MIADVGDFTVCHSTAFRFTGIASKTRQGDGYIPGRGLEYKKSGDARREFCN